MCFPCSPPQPDEILKLSVKRVTQPQIYDNLNQPIAGGLYDHAFGPIEKHDSCVTCGLNANECLGHMGHIELSLPVYHPLLFDLLYKLVKAKCFVCHKFRCNRLKLKLLLTKLRLLDAGLLLLAKSVDEIALKSFNLSVGPDGEEKKGNSSRMGSSGSGSAKKKKSKSKDGEDDEDGAADEPLEDQSDAVKNRLDELLALAETNIRKYGRVASKKEDPASAAKKKKSSSSKSKKEPGVAREPTSHELSYRREVVASFFHEIQSKKCHSCGAFSPQLRRDGHTKIFRLPLTRVQQQSMDLLNLRFDDVLALSEGGFEKGSETWAKMMRERNFHREYQAILRKKKDEKKAATLAARKRKEKIKEKKNERSKGEKAEDDLDGAAAEDDEEGGSDAEADDAAAKDDDADAASDEEADSDAESSGADDEVPPAKSKSSKADKAAAEKADKSGSAKKKKGSKKADAAAAAAAMEIDSDEELDDGKKVLIKLAGDDEEDDSKRIPILMFPNEVEKHIEFLWKQEADVLSTLWGSMCDLLQHEDGESTAGANQHYTAPLNNHRMFFLRVLCVPPSRFRPPTRFGDMLVDHPQNVYFKHILEMDVKLQKMQRGEKILKFEPREPARKTPSKAKPPAADEEEKKEEVTLDLNLLITTWIALQTEINLLLDSTKGGQVAGNALVVPGIRQTFEKKEGLFRRNMMGKRVNFAARSVISPDPFINTNEIGVPELFATQLSYPEPVTPFNVATLRQAVINGPKIHPGANFVEDERGNLIDLAQRSYPQRVALSKTLLTTGLYDSARNKGRSAAAGGVSIGQKRVLRHVRTGDVMIVNRQPTLHKPSMMTHKVRVMRGKASKTQMKSAMWQTIRMHYANCNCYNGQRHDERRTRGETVVVMSEPCSTTIAHVFCVLCAHPS